MTPDIETLIERLQSIAYHHCLTGPSKAAIDDAITALRAVQWRPISEAPKDGTGVLLSCGPWDTVPFVGYWSETHAAWRERIEWTSVYGDGRFESDDPTPTHWMPLPTPPEDQP